MDEVAPGDKATRIHKEAGAPRHAKTVPTIRSGSRDLQHSRPSSAEHVCLRNQHADKSLRLPGLRCALVGRAPWRGEGAGARPDGRAGSRQRPHRRRGARAGASSNKPEIVVVVESLVSPERCRQVSEAIDAVLRRNPEVGACNQTFREEPRLKETGAERNWA